jgi:hypothetical protein
MKIRSQQPRSGGIGVSRGRKPAVKWENNGAAERRHWLRHSLFRPAFRVPLYFAFGAEVRDLSGEGGFLFWLADAAPKACPEPVEGCRSTRAFADTASQKLL